MESIDSEWHGDANPFKTLLNELQESFTENEKGELTVGDLVFDRDYDRLRRELYFLAGAERSIAESQEYDIHIQDEAQIYREALNRAKELGEAFPNPELKKI